MSGYDAAAHQPSGALISTGMATRKGQDTGWRKWLHDGFGEGRPFSKQLTIRMGFTAAFCLAAALLVNMIDGTNVAATKLVPALSRDFMVVYGFVVLGLVAVPVLLFARSWQREIRRELFRLYYTMAAIGGALSIIWADPINMLAFYLGGMLAPWLLVRFGIVDLG